MTQLTTRETNIMNVGGVDYVVSPLERTAEVVKAAELAGSTVIAQQVYADTGEPVVVAAPVPFRLGKDTESSAEQVRGPFIPVHIGTVRALGDAAYFALSKHDTPTTALLPYGTIASGDGSVIGYDLYAVESEL